jgi:hypothetical protein
VQHQRRIVLADELPRHCSNGQRGHVRCQGIATPPRPTELSKASGTNDGRLDKRGTERMVKCDSC